MRRRKRLQLRGGALRRAALRARRCGRAAAVAAGNAVGVAGRGPAVRAGPGAVVWACARPAPARARLGAARRPPRRGPDDGLVAAPAALALMRRQLAGLRLALLAVALARALAGDRHVSRTRVV